MAETMELSKPFSALLLILFLSISSTFHTAFGCGTCPKPKHPKEPPITLPPVIGKPPITLPPIIGKPPITLPPVIGKPPITLPPIIGKPPVTLPPVTLPPIVGKPPITLPPIDKPPVTLPPIVGVPPVVTLPPVIGLPPVTLPPVIGTPILPPIIGTPKLPVPPVTGTPGCPPPPAKTCPVDTVKLGACLEILGNVVHIGDPAVNNCCPIIEGLAGLEAAFCLCTTISWKLLNINIFFPIALELLATCGKSVPPGYTCP